MCMLVDKVKIKGLQKGCANKCVRSTKYEPSYFKQDDVLHFVHDSSSSWKSTKC